MARVLLAAAAAATSSALGNFFRLQTPVSAVRTFSMSQSSYKVSDSVWNLGQLNHVAIAVPDLEKASTFYKDILGAQVSEVVPLPDHGVSVVFVNLGNTKMELLHPLGSNSPIAGFLQKNKAGGIHHVCIEERGARVGRRPLRARRAACAWKRRPCVPYAASRPRPPLFSFPASLAVTVCRFPRLTKSCDAAAAVRLGLADSVAGRGRLRPREARGRAGERGAWRAHWPVAAAEGRPGRRGDGARGVGGGARMLRPERGCWPGQEHGGRRGCVLLGAEVCTSVSIPGGPPEPASGRGGVGERFVRLGWGAPQLWFRRFAWCRHEVPAPGCNSQVWGRSRSPASLEAKLASSPPPFSSIRATQGEIPYSVSPGPPRAAGSPVRSCVWTGP
ncbi:PREDICTED: uncharacterized protein LOC102834744 [Chrysochloris asiatica]|uniref:Uncharacterized protein LOC102834744 n=1 Tax=Chrysochloris asiatica TaxID=185453 RepID=A0A9B0WYS9_CHRAS|nr:PREDICTED: uncharacterized protein LOC102834744 [Chrysochloris asiatica]